MTKRSRPAALYTWQKPDVLRALIDQEIARLGTDFITGQNTDLREGFVACRFAPLAFPGSLVRLVADDRPDFELGPDPVIGFEVAEAMNPDRRRNDEYRKPKLRCRLKGAELHPNTVLDAVRESLATIAEKKAGKDYEAGTRLLVYLNLTTDFFVSAIKVLATARRALLPASTAFAEVWLYWDHRAYRMHPRPFSASPAPEGGTDDDR